MRFNRKGFTLIELIIVIVIIGVLASIATPMMQGVQKKAILTEALVAMGTIRTLERAYYAERNAFYYGGWDFEAIGIKNGDLNGTYVSQKCYFVVEHFGPSHPKSRWRVECWLGPDFNNDSRVPKRDVTNSLFGHPWTLICLYEEGLFTADVSGLGLPLD